MACSVPEQCHYDGSSVDLHTVKFYGYGCPRKLDQTSRFGTTHGAMAPPSHEHRHERAIERLGYVNVYCSEFDEAYHWLGTASLVATTNQFRESVPLQ